MEKPALRLLIQGKLVDGRLPNNHIPRIWAGPGKRRDLSRAGPASSSSHVRLLASRDSYDDAGPGARSLGRSGPG